MKRLLLALVFALPLLAQSDRPLIQIVSANDTTVTYRKLEPPRVALDLEDGSYHVKGCPLLRDTMQWAAPAAAQLQHLQPHACVRIATIEYTTHTAKRRPRDPKVISVLFLGNSLTYWNDLPRITTEIAKGEARPIRAASVTMGGSTLEMLWYRTKALEQLWLEHWDYVIVQERSGRAPHDRGELFHQYLGLFANEIRKSGAQPLIYMTWLPDRAAANEKLFRSAATRARAKLVPAGIAFAELTKKGMNLLEDGTHPNIAGSYLVACSVFSTIYARQAPETPVAFNPAAATLIRQTVWRAVSKK
ncbi:MAG TPA: hypothetical protein VGQ36_27795 [Thermoanaerobaculia bacterium]|jgi:hypothetical protein|nr:hypothetical protein [Thermoanaerobaculia bacterium]